MNSTWIVDPIQDARGIPMQHTLDETIQMVLALLVDPIHLPVGRGWELQFQ
jgi:hypothetical protein